MVNNEQQFGGQKGDQYDEYEQPFDDGDSGSTALGQANTRGPLVVGIAAIAVILVVFSFFSSGDEEEVVGDPDVPVIKEDSTVNTRVPAPAPSFGGDLSMGGESLDLPSIIPPPPSILSAPTPPDLTQPTSASGSFGGGRQASMFGSEDAQERLRSPMFVSGGGSSAGGSFFEGFGSNPQANYSKTSADAVKATQTNNPRFTIGMGKVIDAVLESAIDTGLPGLVRAVVSQNVYAEQGRNILIPKGSRLIGSYTTKIARGQSRVYITWDRVVRADGIDIELESPAAGLLGKSGVLGAVDSRYFEIFSSAVLLSSLEVAFAVAGDSLVDGGSVDSGETGSGDATQTGDVKSIALLNSVNDFGNTVSSVAQELVNLSPIITIDQGTRFKVFVNKDVEFPESKITGIQVIR
jgi:type IV secretion system protein VirB10